MEPTVLPKHVGLIPDGSRRWSKEKDVDLHQAYKLAMEGISRFIVTMFTAKIPHLSIFLLSKENLQRPADHLHSVLAAEIYFFSDIMPKIMKDYNVKVIGIGKRDRLDFPSFWNALDNLCHKNSKHPDKIIYLLTAYSPLDEIYSSSRHLVDADSLLEHLWVPESIDLIIRTGGEKRTSNFLPLQGGFAELIFLAENFNDVTTEHWQHCLLEYQSRKRRIGI